MQDEKTGCGVVIRDYLPAFNTWVETEHGYRLSDHISSTQTEIQGILCGLRELRRMHTGSEATLCTGCSERTLAMLATRVFTLEEMPPSSVFKQVSNHSVAAVMGDDTP